jgi:hypothetical protein
MPDRLPLGVAAHASTTRPHLITIPATDAAFREYLRGVQQREPGLAPTEFQARVRRLFPRVLVRERILSGESAAWYVYRDGTWVAPPAREWWAGAAVPSLTLSAEGWIVDANRMALGLLAIADLHSSPWYYTDFVAPGALADATDLFRIVGEGHQLTVTVLLRPTTGDMIAVDMRAARSDDSINVAMRLAGDVLVERAAAAVQPPLQCLPTGDAAFRRYAEQAVARMPEPTPDGLVLRLRRLYPHASVDLEGDHWVVRRDRDNGPAPERWWDDPTLPRVRYDEQALILEANDAARRLLGEGLVGHHWQEFVTPGSTAEVAAMLAILGEVGAAESRFRIPGADGALVEFDSYTWVTGDELTTVMRPRG